MIRASAAKGRLKPTVNSPKLGTYLFSLPSEPRLAQWITTLNTIAEVQNVNGDPASQLARLTGLTYTVYHLSFNLAQSTFPGCTDRAWGRLICMSTPQH